MVRDSWRIPMRSREGRVPSQPAHMSADLYSWTYFSTQSIWLELRDIDHKPTGIIAGMSDHFRSGMRPIFRAVYEELYRRGQARQNLAMDIRAHNSGLTVTGQPTIANADSIQTRDTIIALRDIVMDAVDAQPLEDNPMIVRCFQSLCDLAINAATPERTRELLYFVLKNPIIFDDDDGMAFLEKAWNLYEMDHTSFVLRVPMINLDGYINEVDNTTPLFDVKMLQHGDEELDFVPPEYMRGYTCLEFYANAKEHFQQNRGAQFNSLHDIYDTYVAVLRDVLPVSFFDMAVVFSQWRYFFARDYWNTYESLLEESPQLKCC